MARYLSGGALVAALCLAACSSPPAADNQSAEVAPDTLNAIVAPAPADNGVAPSADGFGGATTGGDGSQIELTALTEADIQTAELPGELACSFSTDDRSTLLLAKGNVKSREAARGVIKVANYVEDVATAGGFDGMIKGAIFTGKGKTVKIALTGPAMGGGESPPNPAMLTYDRADGARRTVAGRWSCGP